MNNNSIFINVSNHPSTLWGDMQRECAEKYGQIVDIPFPAVDPCADEQEIGEMAEQLLVHILDLYVDCVGGAEKEEILKNGADEGTLTVMAQGEFTLTFALIERLKGIHANVVAACSQRLVREEQMEGGKSRKVVEFEFVQFRKYG